jgi:hypothetical protein
MTGASIELDRLVRDIADAVVRIDSARLTFKSFQPGVGPFGEPQLVKLVAKELERGDDYKGLVFTRRTPDLLIKGKWALEFKIARPFGDNGKEAENWSVNLLHPYAGNVSVIGDCLKLMKHFGEERKSVIVIGYEHTPPRIELTPLLSAFECIARDIAGIALGPRIASVRSSLIHPIHQQVSVVAWEVRS